MMAKCIHAEISAAFQSWFAAAERGYREEQGCRVFKRLQQQDVVYALTVWRSTTRLFKKTARLALRLARRDEVRAFWTWQGSAASQSVQQARIELLDQPYSLLPYMDV